MGERQGIVKILGSHNFSSAAVAPCWAFYFLAQTPTALNQGEVSLAEFHNYASICDRLISVIQVIYRRQYFQGTSGVFYEDFRRKSLKKIYNLSQSL